MDVLELPRPVINFLRTMSKEMHRYSLCWDIYGGSESVTLTLTWKINCDKSEDEHSFETSKQKHQQHINKLMNSEVIGNLSMSTSLVNNAASTQEKQTPKSAKTPPPPSKQTPTNKPKSIIVNNNTSNSSTGI